MTKDSLGDAREQLHSLSSKNKYLKIFEDTKSLLQSENQAGSVHV